MAVFSSLPLFLYLSHLPAISLFSCCLQCTEKASFQFCFHGALGKPFKQIVWYQDLRYMQLFNWSLNILIRPKYCLYYTYSMNFKQLFIGCMSIYISRLIKVTATKFYVNVPILQCRKVLFCIKTHPFFRPCKTIKSIKSVIFEVECLLLVGSITFTPHLWFFRITSSYLKK